MKIMTVSSREFNQDVSKLKKASLKGPIFITDRGHPAHVLLSIKDYQKLTKTQENIVEMLIMPDAASIEFEVAKLKNGIFKKKGSI